MSHCERVFDPAQNYQKVVYIEQCFQECSICCFRYGVKCIYTACMLASDYELSIFIPDDIPDEFFEVTVDDLRLMLKDLKNERYFFSVSKCTVVRLAISQRS